MLKKKKKKKAVSLCGALVPSVSGYEFQKERSQQITTVSSSVALTFIGAPDLIRVVE